MRIDSAADKRIAKIGLIAGLSHLIFVLWVHQTIRNETVWMRIAPGTVEGVILRLYAGIGLVLLGGIAAALAYRDRLFTPIGTLVVWFSVTTYQSWHSLETARASSTQPALTVRPDTLYVFAWFVPLGVVLVTAIVEQTVRKHAAELR